MDWIIVPLSSLIGVLSGVIGSYYMLNRTLDRINFSEIVDEVTDDILQNTDMQKKIYTVGALIGNGVKAGVGLNPSRGKFKLEDLITMGIAKFFGAGDLLNSQPQQTPQQPNQKVGYP